MKPTTGTIFYNVTSWIMTFIYLGLIVGLVVYIIYLFVKGD